MRSRLTSLSMVNSAVRACATLVAIVAISSIGSSPAVAAPILFYGHDQAPGPDGPTPNSDAAYAAFLAALNPASVGVEDFESEALGGIGTLPIAFPSTAVTGTITDLAFFGSQVAAQSAFDFPRSGAQMLSSGSSGASNFFELALSTPQYAFGFFGVGFSDYLGAQGPPFSIPPIAVSLDGGAPIAVINVDPLLVAVNSVNFFGIISDSPFSSVVFINPTGTFNDGISVDDIVIGSPRDVAAVPEPGTLALIGVGALGLLARRYRR
jgi:hypothetical protein